MRKSTFFTRFFFIAAAALMFAAGALAPGGALWAQDEISTDDDSDAVAERCPGQTQPVCRTKTSGGTTDYYYFP